MAEYDPITVARLWSKVSIPRSPRHAEMCWEWRGSRVRGYGQLKVNGHPLRAHRMAYELVCGAVPDGLMVLHSCDNPKCCNPAHLRAGTAADNYQDAVERGRTLIGTGVTPDVLARRAHRAKIRKSRKKSAAAAS